MIQIDMPMPKCCDECFALDEHGDYPYCLISQDQRGYTFNTRDRRMPTCPLKAQEPRVMTLEEVKQHNNQDGCVCFEQPTYNAVAAFVRKEEFEIDRMCLHYQRKRKCPMECPMNGVNISQCRKIAFEEPDVTEKTVMSWAAEHPEPVYPSWVEYLVGIGVIPHKIRLKTADALMDTHLLKPIPADIAKKLGVEPKEG